MTHIPEEQSKAEPVVEKAVVKTPEVLSSSHDILGKQYEFNGVSFTVLGIEPIFHEGSDDMAKDLPLNIFTVTDIQSKKVPLVPFQGGIACITKIQIGDEVITGYDEIIKRTVIIEQVPENWMTNKGLAKELGVHENTLSRRTDFYRKFHPKWFHIYLDSRGHLRGHYAPELCDLIRKELSQREYTPEGWMTKGTLRKELKVNEKKVVTFANQYRSSHPEWFHQYLDNGGHLCEYYAPKLCDLIRKELPQKEYAPEGWITKEELASLIGRNYTQVKPKANKYRKSHPEWFQNYWTPNGNHEHYAPKLCDLIRKELSQGEYAPEGWMTNGNLAREFKDNFERVKLLADIYRPLHSEWFQNYWTSNGNHEHYAPELCDLIRKELSQGEYAPEGWMTKEALRKELKVNEKKIRTFANQYRSLHPEWSHVYLDNGGHLREHYTPELCDLIRKELSLQEYAPEDWMTNSKLAREFKDNFERIQSLANIYRFSHPEWFHNYKSKTHYTEHYAPELCDLIRQAVNDKRS